MAQRNAVQVGTGPLLVPPWTHHSASTSHLTHVIITIVTLKTRSLMAGFNSFLAYNALPWVILTILGLLSSAFVQSNITHLPLTPRLFFMGFSAASAGIMVRSSISHITETWPKWPKLLLTGITAVIFYCNQSLATLLGCLALGAIVSLYQEI